MLYVHSLLGRLHRDTRGATAVEYAILVGVIGGALALAATTFGSGLSSVFGTLLTTAHLQ
jgi:Flp pilus assembly pilin Flp